MSREANIGFQAKSPSGDEGYVIMLFPPDADGMVRYREWPCGQDPELPGRDRQTPAGELVRRVEEWRRAGWKFTESPIRITHWLTEGR